MQPAGPPPGGGVAEPAPAGQGPKAPEAPDESREPESRRRGTDIKVALIGAAATVLAALIAGALAVNSGTVEINVPESGASRDDLRTTITSLAQEIDELRRANEDLQADLDQARDSGGSTGSGSPPRTSPAPAEPSGDVVNDGTNVPLTPYQFIDLDTDAPDWGVTDEDPTGDTDIGIDSSPSLYTANDAEVAVMPELPSFDDCRRATALTTGLTSDQTSPDTHLCVRTSDGAYAYVGIVQVVNHPASVTIDITVWAS